jgi:hypothetical protein
MCGNSLFRKVEKWRPSAPELLIPLSVLRVGSHTWRPAQRVVKEGHGRGAGGLGPEVSINRMVATMTCVTAGAARAENTCSGL